MATGYFRDWHFPIYLGLFLQAMLIQFLGGSISWIRRGQATLECNVFLFMQRTIKVHMLNEALI